MKKKNILAFGTEHKFLPTNAFLQRTLMYCFVMFADFTVLTICLFYLFFLIYFIQLVINTFLL